MLPYPHSPNFVPDPFSFLFICYSKVQFYLKPFEKTAKIFREFGNNYFWTIIIVVINLKLRNNLIHLNSIHQFCISNLSESGFKLYLGCLFPYCFCSCFDPVVVWWFWTYPATIQCFSRSFPGCFSNHCSLHFRYGQNSSGDLHWLNWNYYLMAGAHEDRWKRRRNTSSFKRYQSFFQ